jgi:hypothetical protein
MKRIPRVVATTAAVSQIASQRVGKLVCVAAATEARSPVIPMATPPRPETAVN